MAIPKQHRGINTQYGRSILIIVLSSVKQLVDGNTYSELAQRQDGRGIGRERRHGKLRKWVPGSPQRAKLAHAEDCARQPSPAAGSPCTATAALWPLMGGDTGHAGSRRARPKDYSRADR